MMIEGRREEGKVVLWLVVPPAALPAAVVAALPAAAPAE